MAEYALHGTVQCCQIARGGIYIPPGLAVPGVVREAAVSYAQGLRVGYNLPKLRDFWGIGLGLTTVTVALPDDYGTPLQVRSHRRFPVLQAQRQAHGG